MRIILVLSLMIIFVSENYAQHFDPIYNQNTVEFRTWRDSGYYFVPEIINWTILKSFSASDDLWTLKISFSSTDESGLNYNGKAFLLIERDRLPAGIEFSSRMKGQSLILLPQDLLLCPTEAQEMAMGQNDPYFPLYLAGTIIRIQASDIQNAIPVNFQLNDFKVN